MRPLKWSWELFACQKYLSHVWLQFSWLRSQHHRENDKLPNKTSCFQERPQIFYKICHPLFEPHAIFVSLWPSWTIKGMGITFLWCLPSKIYPVPDESRRPTPWLGNHVNENRHTHGFDFDAMSYWHGFPSQSFCHKIILPWFIFCDMQAAE